MTNTATTTAAIIFPAVTNNHIASCGEPIPQMAVPADYDGYFCNEHGEQFVFKAWRGERDGMLWCGEMGWESGFPVREERSAGAPLLNREESLWLVACLGASYALRRAKSRKANGA